MPELWAAFGQWWSIIWSITTFIPAWWRDMQGIEDYAHQIVNS